MDPKAYANSYEGDSSDARFFRKRLGIVLESISGLKAGKALDAGCGPGIMARQLIKRNWNVVGLDLSPAMIKECVESIGLSTNSDFICGPVKNLPFADELFDLLLAMGVLEYTTEEGGAGEALRELARVTKKGGVVIASMHNKVSPYRLWERMIYNNWIRMLHGKGMQTRTRIYSERSFHRLIKSSGLEVEDSVYYDFNVIVPPLDGYMPRKAAIINERLEPFIGKHLKWFGSGFIVKARKI